MKKRAGLSGWVLLLGCLVLASPSPAETEANRWLQVQKHFASVTSIRTEFSQKKELKILRKPLVSEGRFFFRAPGDIRWEYTSPIESILLAEGGDVKRYVKRDASWVQEQDPGLEAMGQVLRDMSGWLTGDFESSPHFRAELEAGPPVRVILLPRQAAVSSFIERVVLTLSPKPGVLDSVEIVEGPGNSTLIEFQNTEINVPLGKELFER
jgi:outer membrane lipoprotein-sorting protein